MRDRRNSEFRPLPSAADSSPIALALAFAVAALLAAGLVAASYPAVALPALAGALTVPLIRRVGSAVRSFRARRAGKRGAGVHATFSVRAE